MAIVLFEDKKECCGCGACMNICPKNAITMEPDPSGFLYPCIHDDICIECGACKKVCAYQNDINLNEPLAVYAAVNRNEEQLMFSASGGVFSAIAEKVLNENGVVFGATLSFENGYAYPHHIAVETIEDLPKLQGSKYVQSSIGNTYEEAKKFLLSGRKVLFSGTPCQVAGLYGFLGKDYEELITVDVICHGVPNEAFFNGYLQEEKKKRNAKMVTGYAFRDKTKGWGYTGRIDLLKKNDECQTVYVPARAVSYNTLFLNGEIFRENCYSCKYARKSRPSDMTIGDYWGIETEHPELLGKNGFDERKGISCILANSEKGIAICKNMKDLLRLHESSFKNVSHKNGQLKAPSPEGKAREEILKIYESNGYPAVEKWFQKKFRKQIIIHTLYNKIPRGLRLSLKKLLKG